MTASRQTTSPVLDGYEAYGCRVNAITPEELFERYGEAGFLYAAKLERLQPFIGEIAENWRRALRAGELIHWVATFEDPRQRAWASISSWRSTHAGWVTQHLVSIGGPVASRAVLLAGQAVRIREGLDRSHQSWFRPENRFPNRVFGSLTGSVGSADSCVVPYTLCSVALDTAGPLASRVPVTAVSRIGEADLFELASRARGPVYAQAEELDHEDLLLDEVDRLYRHVGLRRYRRIWIACHGSELVGAAIAYRGPLGFNFSFLENRCDLLVDPALPSDRVAPVVSSLLQAAASSYANFRPAQIPLVVGARELSAAIACGAVPIRNYSQSIWLQSGFEAMYKHMAGFYERIIRAHRRRGLGSPRGPGDIQR